MKQVKPPRAAFLNFPLGHQCGNPGDIDLQTNILKDSLNILTTASIPGEVKDLTYEWGRSFDWSDYMKGIEEMLNEENAPIQL